MKGANAGQDVCHQSADYTMSSRKEFPSKDYLPIKSSPSISFRSNNCIKFSKTQFSVDTRQSSQNMEKMDFRLIQFVGEDIEWVSQ